jgi:DNA-binding response OmpR family regulator
MKLQERRISMTSARQAKRISRLHPRGQIGKKTITCNDNNRVVGIDEQIILCTNTEYQIILMLLDQKPLADSALIHQVFHCSPDSSMIKNLRRHIEHLREKLDGTGIDIQRGYLLVETEMEAV